MHPFPMVMLGIPVTNDGRPVREGQGEAGRGVSRGSHWAHNGRKDIAHDQLLPVFLPLVQANYMCETDGHFL